MMSLLPDLTPRDSHSLWYTSTRNPFSSRDLHDAHGSPAHDHQQQQNNASAQAANHRRGAHLIERSPLARLRADEQNLDRRRQNVTNFGSAWLKPPGIPKTLHQLREERREAEEHAEALRREQLAQELAEAEAQGAAGAGVGDGGGVVDASLDDAPMGDGGGDDDGMDDVQLDGARDLDDEIPEADTADFALSAVDDDEDVTSDEDEDEDEEEEMEQRAEHAQQQLMQQRMRHADDAFRENVVRGRDSAGFYGVDEEVDDEDQAQMIEEEDLVGQGDDGDMGMDGDLDDDIPEAESMGGYEHTDTEEEIDSSSDDDDDDHGHVSFAAQVPRSARMRHSLARSDATRNSIAISDILSRDGSSVLDSSPQIPRYMDGSARRGRG
ncbi:Apc15p protein-domain-containing protein [Xylariaceae sp. FL0016]|nr:Apc15p protein-domain-containing protein [Xylariaceae sp. FL0016]